MIPAEITETVDLLVKNSVGETSENFLHPNRWAADSFRTRLEILAVEHGMNNLIDSTIIFYWIFGSILTLPHLPKFRDLKIRKIAYRYSDKYLEIGFLLNNSKSKFFILKTVNRTVDTITDDFETCNHDLNSAKKSMKEFYIMTIEKPANGEIYEVFTSNGVKRFASNSKSPIMISVKNEHFKSRNGQNVNCERIKEFTFLEKSSGNLKRPADSLHNLHSKIDAIQDFMSFLFPIFRSFADHQNTHPGPEMFSHFVQGVIELNLRFGSSLRYEPVIGYKPDIFHILAISNEHFQFDVATHYRIELADSQSLHLNDETDDIQTIKSIKSTEFLTSTKGINLVVNKDYLNVEYDGGYHKIMNGKQVEVFAEVLNIFQYLLVLSRFPNVRQNPSSYNKDMVYNMERLQRLVDTKNSNYSVAFFLAGQLLGMQDRFGGRVSKYHYSDNRTVYRSGLVTTLVAHLNKTATAVVVNVFESQQQPEDEDFLYELSQICQLAPKIDIPEVQYVLQVNLQQGDSLTYPNQMCKFDTIFSLLNGGDDREDQKLSLLHNYKPENLFIALNTAKPGVLFGFPDGANFLNLSIPTSCTDYTAFLVGLTISDQTILKPFSDLPCILAVSSTTLNETYLLKIGVSNNLTNVQDRSFKSLHFLAERYRSGREIRNSKLASWILHIDQTTSWVVISKIDPNSNVMQWCSASMNVNNKSEVSRSRRDTQEWGQQSGTAKYYKVSFVKPQFSYIYDFVFRYLASRTIS